MAFRKSIQQQQIIASDETKVAGQAWKVLKHQAMKDGFEFEEWYKSLNESDKELVIQLIDSQKAQDDMGELKPIRIFLEVKSAAKESMKSDDE